MAFEAGQTGVVVPVPDAEPLVSAWRERFDRSAPLGVPAHVTVLYPFLPRERVDEAVLTDLAAICRRVGPVEVTFRRTGWFEDADVLWLDPEPAAPFVDLTGAIAARWPDAQPYCGVFDEVTPHLTVAEAAPEGEVERMQDELAASLPLRTVVDRAWLYAFDGQAWSPVRALPLSG